MEDLAHGATVFRSVEDLGGGLSNALPTPVRCLAFQRTGRLPRSGHGVARNRSEASTSLIRTARRGTAMTLQS
jgi:hypothetical protein